METAAAGGAQQVEVTFSRVCFCDCAGLNLLLATSINCQDRGVGLSVSRPVTPAVARLFQLAGAGRLLLMPQSRVTNDGGEGMPIADASSRL
ncbi:STAS domain-containing protein [Streptomyces sp. NPDC049915]|uniref:STAS domain-containing protein n=1 Tax=Streptomyces sp. NPDC049915 TaxID=3155510 RepID=UPI003426CF84